MELVIKVGNKRPETDPNFAHDLRDGQILGAYPDGTFPAVCMERQHFCVIQTPHDYFSLFGASGYDDLHLRSAYYQFKRFIEPATADGKWNFIENKMLDFSTPHRKREFFIDFKRLLDAGWITNKQYISIYDHNSLHDPIYIDRDILGLQVLGEDSNTRLPPKPGTVIPVGSISSGTHYVRADGADGKYVKWSAACADIAATLTGNLTIEGELSEVITETSSANVTCNTATYTLTLRASSGVKHSGTYGGHRIYFSTNFDYFLFDEVTADTLKQTTVEDLSFLIVDGNGARAAWYEDPSTGATGGPHYFRRNIVAGAGKTATNGAWGVFNNRCHGFYVINNIIYNVDTGLVFFENTTNAGQALYLYNNTIGKCTKGVYQDGGFTGGIAVTTKNNMTQGCTAGWVNDGAGFGTTSKNVSEDASSPDVAYRSLNCHDGNSCFTDYANDNYLLTSGGDELTTLDDGDDLSGTFTGDVIGTTRSTWYIGASELAAAAGLDIPIAMHHYKMLRN